MRVRTPPNFKKTRIIEGRELSKIGSELSLNWIQNGPTQVHFSPKVGPKYQDMGFSLVPC